MSYIKILDYHINIQGIWGYPKQHKAEGLRASEQKETIFFQQQFEIIFIFSYPKKVIHL